MHYTVFVNLIMSHISEPENPKEYTAGQPDKVFKVSPKAQLGENILEASHQAHSTHRKNTLNTANSLCAKYGFFLGNSNS